MTDPQTKFENRLAKKILLRGSTALLTLALAAAVTVTSGIVPEPVSKTAQAQNVSLTVQFRTALEPHGRWQRHGRWGEVWIPSKRDRDWRPYTAGRWEYTDRWGWYWVSDEDFGWVTYHYGRWVLTSEFGWVWIPGNEWGPAWVQWRRGDRHAGWAPLPPREVIYEYDDDPDFWIFVSFNNFTARNISRVILPPRERTVYIRETVIVNRTIIIDRDGGDRARFAVNPGIEPRIVAARAGKPIRVSNVKPVVVAGTVGVESAVEVRAEDARKQRNRTRAQVSESKETVEPAKDVPPPQALKKGEEGRLGERPPEAAKGGKPVPASQADDRAKDDDAAKSKSDDDAKSKGDAAAKSKSDDAKSRAKSKADDDDAKSKAADDAKSRAKPKADADDAKSVDDAKSRAKPKADDDAKSKASDDAKSRSKAAEDAKSKADDGTKGARSKASDSESKAEPKSRERDAGKSKPEPKQAAPKEAPEPKRAAPKEAAPKQAPEPRRAAPEPKQAPKSAPEPKQAAPKAAPEPKAPPAPKAPPPAPKGGDEREKGKEG